MSTERNLIADIRMNDAYETAADWLQRLEHPDVKEEDLQSWLEWFGSSDMNRKAFEELQVLCRRLREMPPELHRELRQRTASQTSVEPKPDARPPASKRNSRMLPFRTWAFAASIAMVAVAVAAWWTIHTRVNEAVYSAASGLHQTVALKDGSLLVLSSDSVVSVAYSRHWRTLDMQRGAAYFEVAADSSRPFVVKVGGIHITAIGTAFNVRRDAQQVTVTVTEGRVAVQQSAGRTDARAYEQTHLDVGQHVVLPIATSAPLTVVSQPAAVPDWHDGRVDFIDAPLSEVLPVINRHAPVKLVIDDPRVGDLTYSGSILHAHIDEWIASLPHLYPIRAVPLDNGTVTLVSQPGKQSDR